MATASLTTSPTQIDAGSSDNVSITNTGAVDVVVARGAQSYTLRPTQGRVVYPEGVAVTAAAVSGSGSVSYTATAARLSQQAQFAADPAFTGTYGPAVGVARRILSNAAVYGSDLNVSPLTPTVTLGTVSAAPTITSAVRIAPRRLSSTVIDAANDPHFDFQGAIPGRLVPSSSDMTYPNFLTGGSSQAARNVPRIRFDYTGQAVELYFRMRTTSFSYRIYVDGLPLTAALQTATVTTTGRYYLKIDFGSATTRRVEIEVVDPEFGGAAIEPTATITRPMPSLLLAGFGDSHTRGANGVNWLDTWVRVASNVLHLDWANLGIGGSGYLPDNGTTGANYRNRLTTDIIPLAPDVLVFEGSWNDTASTSAALAAEAAYCFATLKAALPNTLLIAAGPWVVGHSLNATLDTFDATLRAQAQAVGWHGYISYRDPVNLKGSANAWAATTAYVVGDTVVQNGFAQTCVVGHTSTGSFDQTKWRSTAIVTGTGKVGTTAGDGSADVIVSSDGVHNTLLGHQVKGRHVAAEVLRIARTVASGTLWAN